jgi:DNA polymerase elongation subunit (family B)
MKDSSESGSPDYIIAKILLNSLYGRLGMNPIKENHIIQQCVFRYILESKNKNITNVIKLVGTDQELISFFDPIDSNSDKEKLFNVSVPISSAVTAYARIHTSKIKMELIDLGIKLYYYDTDSFDIDKPLPSKYIGRELGKLKLENIFEEVVYLAPKVYGGLIKDKDEQIYDFVKVKGLKNPITFKELSSLLIKDTELKIKNEK